jgi:hypothetical protein
MAASSKPRKAAPRKRKTDWYQKGMDDAAEYWREMAEPEKSDITAYFACAGDIMDEEMQERGEPKDHADRYSRYARGLGAGIQSVIDDLIQRAALFDAVVVAVRKGVQNGKG